MIPPAEERRTVDLSKARVLLTNDDGIQAEGLAVLERAIAPHVAEVWTIAPAAGRSAASGMVSLRRNLALDRMEARRVAVDGTPVDCVLAALGEVMAETPPDLVLSGINHGANLGDDLNSSGTVGAAVFAAREGIPAIALSLARGPDAGAEAYDWNQAETRTGALVARLCGEGFAPRGLYAVNFPHAPADADAPAVVRPAGAQGGSFRVERLADGRLFVQHEGDRGLDDSPCDYAAVRAGRIAVTPLATDRTDHGLLRALPEAF